MINAPTVLFLIVLVVPATHAALTRCVVQAFGSGLGGKGIEVTVESNGFGCTDVFPWNDVTKSAKFDSTGEAEVPLSLHADVFGICMTNMHISITLPYTGCTMPRRYISQAQWSNSFAPSGSCRALQQRCGGKVSNAAIPYIDMWCVTPSGQIFETLPQEMRVTWQSSLRDDKC